MRKFFLHSISFFLAVFYFFTSFGFSLNEHFCQGEIREASVWLEAASCEMPETEDACESKQICKTDKWEKNICCEDESHIISTPGFLSELMKKVEFLRIQIVLTNVFVLFVKSEGFTVLSLFFSTPPPLLQKNATEQAARLQIFLC